MPLLIDFIFKEPSATGTLGMQIAFKDERDYRKQLAAAQRSPLGTFKTFVGEIVTLEMANIHHAKSGVHVG